MRAAFEPSLGVVQTELLVAEDKTNAVPIEETFTENLADCRLLRTLKGAVLCSRRDTVDVFRNGARESSFPGTELAVVGDIAWSLNQSTLERRVDTGQALTLEGTFMADFAQGVVGTHTETRAVRATRGSTTLSAVELTWNGASLSARSWQPAEAVPLGSVITVDGDALWQITPGNPGRETELCTFGTSRECVSLFSKLANVGLPEPLGFSERGAWWVNPTFGNPAAFVLNVVERPFSATAPRIHTVNVRSQRFVGDFSHQISGESEMRFFVSTDEKDFVIPSLAGGAITFTWWPRGTVRSVSADWLVLDGPNGSTFRFYRR